MSAEPTSHNGVNSSTILPGWARELPDITTGKDGRISIGEYGVGFQNRSQPIFYPLPLLRHVFTEKALSIEINALGRLEDTEAVVRQVLGKDCAGSKTYLQIFALLKVIDLPDRLPHFIHEDVSDQELPLVSDKREGTQILYRKSGESLSDNLLQTYAEIIAFETQQYSMIVHSFGKQTQPYDLAWDHVPPYYTINPPNASEECLQLSGSSGSVARIIIHPLCHEFHGAFDCQNEEMFFALKKYRHTDTEGFQREVKMLRKFKEINHPHIVVLLDAYTWRHEKYLIFPWATHDLNSYWARSNPTPDASSVQLVQWICKQSWQLSDAVSHIHNLDEENKTSQEEHRYERHGDLKPENILWYKSREGFGNLVIADMGLRKTPRFEGRTYIQDKAIAMRRYRPPEAEYADGLIDQTVDIWALGCTFLEFLIWLHRGRNLLEEVEQETTTRSIRGYGTTEYFEWVRMQGAEQGAEQYAIRVKSAVTDYIDNIRQDCSQFAYDFLGIIRNRMLVVERDDRISAKELAEEMKILNEKCTEGTAYCVQKETRQARDSPNPKLKRRQFHKDLPTAGKGSIPQVPPSDFI
ncbi:hypothetical protein EKO27_g2246 [Xylaria grammica]|uniref:Protein kinase domain-containing protein n=1 Tax=Xylaria grammica TaxID=363999 RepID=A0A439DEN9_9PEZI|nr:hypothetical protein EKO27_g2246 [Xylaria grammica]